VSFSKRQSELFRRLKNSLLLVLQVMEELLRSLCVATMLPASELWTSRLTRSAPNSFMHYFSHCTHKHMQEVKGFGGCETAQIAKDW
jgi:hypothetical protein